MRANLGDDSAQIFSKKLLEIGDGRFVVESSGNVELPTDFCNMVSSIAEIIYAIYPGISQNYLNLDWLRERVIIAAKNEDINEIINHIPCHVTGSSQ
jgi:hypothetical protein